METNWLDAPAPGSHFRQMHDPAPEGNGHRLGEVAHLEFGEDVFDVGLHGLLGNTDPPFDQSRFERLTPGQLNDPATSGPQADPDKDGTVNLLEFFAGRDPLTADAPPKVSLEGGNPRIFETERHPEARRLFIRVERSGNLRQWLAADTGGNPPAVTVADSFHRLRFTLADEPGTGGFYRLAVSRNPFP